MKDFFSLVLMLLLCAATSSAQDTLILKNGKRYVGKQTGHTANSLSFDTGKKGIKTFKATRVDFIKTDGRRQYVFNQILQFNGNTRTVASVRLQDKLLFYVPINSHKEKRMKTEKAFSYVVGDTETVLFKPYIFNNDTLTVDNARSLLEGRQDARRYYKNPWTGLANFGIGFASGYFMNYWGIFVPAAYTGVYSAINPLKSKRKIRLLGERYVTDNFYRYGFNSKAKITKLKWSAGGGVLGLAAGVGLLEYLKSLEKE